MNSSTVLAATVASSRAFHSLVVLGKKLCLNGFVCPKVISKQWLLFLASWQTTFLFSYSIGLVGLICLLGWLGVRYVSGGIEGRRPFTILKKKVNLCRRLLSCSVGSFSFSSMVVTHPGCRDL